MFLLVSGGHICARQRDTAGHQHGVSIQSLINLGKTFFPKISHMNYRTDLILGEDFCLFIFFHLPDSELSRLHFHFWWRDSKNTEQNYSIYIYFSKVEDSAHLAARPTEKKTTISSFQRLRSPQNSTWTTADNNSTIRPCSASDNHKHAEGIILWQCPLGRIERRLIRMSRSPNDSNYSLTWNATVNWSPEQSYPQPLP